MGIDPITHKPLDGQKQPQQTSPTTTSAQSSTITTAESKSGDGQQEDKHVDAEKDITSAGDESIRAESLSMNTNNTTVGITIDNQDFVKWLLEEDLPTGDVDEPWLNFTTSDHVDDLDIITATTTPWDIVGMTDWLLDYQDLGVGDSSFPLDVSMVGSSKGSNSSYLSTSSQQLAEEDANMCCMTFVSIYSGSVNKSVAHLNPINSWIDEVE